MSPITWRQQSKSKWISSAGDASMSCVKLHYPESGYTVPVYAEPTASKREES